MRAGNIIEELIISVLKNDLEGSQELIERSSVDLHRLLEVVERHRVSAVVFQRLAKLNFRVPEHSLATAIASDLVFATMASNAIIRREIRRIASIFGKCDIDFLLLKGMAIDKTPLRRTGDLDILIRNSDLQRAFTRLHDEGFRYDGSEVVSEKEMRNPLSQVKWNNQYQFSYPGEGLSVEIHTNLFERGRVRLEDLDPLLDRIDLFWERSRWDQELGCKTPSVEASLALLCVHSATKRSPAYNTYLLRHSCDIDALLRSGFDSNRFLAICSTWRIGYYAYVAMRLASRNIEVDGSRTLASKLAQLLTRRERHLAEIHLRCYRGLGPASQYHRFRYWLLMPWVIGRGIGGGFLWYLRFFLPPLWRQERLFGIRRESPFFILTYILGPFMRLYGVVVARLRD